MNKYLKNVFRNILQNKFSYIGAVAIISIGVFVFIAISDFLDNLEIATQRYLNETNYADAFVYLEKAPESVLSELDEIKGVEAVIGRLEKNVRLMTEKQDKIVTIHLMGYNNEDNINKILLSPPVPAMEQDDIYISPQMAHKHGFKPSDEIKITVDGKEKTYIYRGDAYSAEHMGTAGDGAVASNYELYDIAAVDKESLETLVGEQNIINTIYIKFENGYEFDDLKFYIEQILEKYGINDILAKQDSEGYSGVFDEISGMAVIAQVLPFLFMAVSVFLLYIIIKKMIEKDRILIGTMKAFGATDREILGSYCFQGVVIGILGGLLPIFPAEILGKYLFRDDTTYYNIPSLYSYSPILKNILIGFAISFFTSMFSVIVSVLGILKINPSESMRAAAPVVKGAVGLPSFVDKLLNIRQKISLRSIFRNFFRNIVIAISIAFPYAMIVAMGYFALNVDTVLNQQFVTSQLYDVKVNLTNYNDKTIAQSIQNDIENIEKSTSISEYSIKLTAKNRNKHITMRVMDPNSELIKITDVYGQTLELPDDGIIVSKKLSNEMNINIGDNVEVNNVYLTGEKENVLLNVKNIVSESYDQCIYISEENFAKSFNALCGYNVILLNTAEGQKENVISSFAKKDNITFVTDRKETEADLLNALSTLSALISGLAAFATIAGIVMIYNITYMTLMERKNEFGTMMVLGMTDKEIREIIAYEQIFNFVLGIALGFLLVKPMSATLEYGVYESGSIISLVPDTGMYILAFFVCFAMVFFSGMVISKKVTQMQLTDVLKERE
ncbi:MAG: ABC transporter permease [Firmicutes bacterium]|nr:ABC transporter permease [Bacillota bacterium]